MADYDEAGRLIISRAKQLDKIPETYEPSMRLTKDMPFSMLNLGRDEIIFIPEWDFD